MLQKIRWAILIFGILALVAAMIQNSEPVRLKLFFFETEMPTAILLLATSAISFLIGGLTVGRFLWRREAAQSEKKTTPPPKTAFGNKP